MAKTKGPTMLEDETEEQAGGEDTAAVDVAVPALIEEGRPVCRKHNCVMQNNGNHGGVDYYRCQVPDCTETQKLARPTEKVPTKPTHCPQKDCEGRFLEVDPKRSQGTALLVMVCAHCGFTTRAPSPMVNPQRLQARRAEVVEDLSAR